MIFPLLLLVVLSLPFPCQAADMGDSILEIPKDTIFHLRYELELPANRKFFLLGKDAMDESFNEIHQAMNDNDVRFYNILTIYFDHDVVEGLAVVTTHPLDDISIQQLQYSEEGKDKGFWAGFADLMGNLRNIAGVHFEIKLPETRYYD